MFNVDTTNKVRVQVRKMMPLKPENIRLKHRRCNNNAVFGKAYDNAPQVITTQTCDCQTSNNVLFEVY